MRRITVGAAALVMFAVGTGITEMGLHGFKFFVFRPGGTGSTPGSVINDQQFLNREQHETTAHSSAKAHHEPTRHHEPKGGHHRATKKANK